MTQAIWTCPDCGRQMRPVMRNAEPGGKFSEPLRFVCKCGKMVYGQPPK